MYNCPEISAFSEILDQAVQGTIPALQCSIILDGQLFHSSAHGVDHLGQSTRPESLFDIASVTKMAATSVTVATLIEKQVISLEDPVRRFLPSFEGPGKDTVTIRELLSHSSGLPAWEPLFTRVLTDPVGRSAFLDPSGRDIESFNRARELVIDATLKTPLTAHRGTRIYSDLGFIILGLILEKVGETGLDQLCSDTVYSRINLENTSFFPLIRHISPGRRANRHILPTGQTRPREPAPGQESLYTVPPQQSRVCVGEVDDDNAYALGGVAGHAGLFSTSRDLATLGWAILAELEGAAVLEAGEALRQMVVPDTRSKGANPRGLGFDMPSRVDSAVGNLLGRRGPRGAVGHLGFTGCSLWLDLDRRLVVSLLANRTFPGREHVVDMRRLRPVFHDTVVRLVDQR